jgi:hypothetical protein
MTLAVTVLLAVGMMGFTPASASPDVIRQGACPDGAKWRFELSDHGARIEVNFEVRRSPVGDRWDVRLKHNGVVFFQDARTAKDGEFSVDRFVRDRTGTDRFRGRAIDRTTGEVCKGAAHI